MIRALVFDFDGLILDTESALIDAYGDVHRAHGFAFDRALFLRSVGHADYTFNPWKAFGPYGHTETLENERRRANRERDLALPLLPGVTALLDAARTAGLTVGLASNSPQEHCHRHLTRLGLLDRFAFLACRGDVPSPKPEPDLYKLVLNRFGLGGTEAIAFEDSYTGSIAAKRAGLWTVVCPGPSTGEHDFAHADLRVASLAEVDLAALLARFCP